MARALLLAALAAAAAAERQRFLLDAGWKFNLGAPPSGECPNPNSTFPVNLDGQQCLGLALQAAVTSATDCQNYCCGESACATWQWCGAGGCSGGAQANQCWVGQATSCQSGSGWVGRGRNIGPGPGPGPNTTCGSPWCSPSTDDSAWRSVNVPHDFVVEGNFSQSASKSQGYLPFNVGFYRRHFTLPSSLQGVQTLYIDIEAAQTASTVYLNGHLLGTHASGYTPQRYFPQISTLNFGGDNVLAVQVDATQPDSWWYDGGGIYRHVWLTAITTPGPYLAPWGVYAASNVTGSINWPAGNTSTPVADAVLLPSVEVWTNATSGGAQSFSISLTVVDKATGAVVATGGGSGSIAPSNITVWTSSPIPLQGAKLWHLVAPPSSPALYMLTTTLTVGGVVVDAQNTTFGIRATRWDGATGFWLNGVNTKILGAANHQDFAAVGVAVPDHIQAHRVAKLKDLGMNGWRTAHNPPNPALLDAADELGFVVWDENHRNGQPTELELLVKRDRNHPSVVIWSICNEVLCNTADTAGDAAKMNALFHALDPLGGRPVSANYNGFVGPNTPLDVQGFDYSTQNYDHWHSEAPNIPSISSETSSAVSDRAEYVNDGTAGHVSGYDNNYPGWGESAEQAWGGVGVSNGQGILTRPFISGGWTWTGWDYRGEPTPYAWPDTNSHFGIIDLCGFEKDRSYWYKAWFAKPSPPVLHLLPVNWNSNPVGTGDVPIWAFGNVATVELFINGVSSGNQSMPTYGHVEWHGISYTPGELRVVGYDASGASVAEDSVRTTGAPAALQIAVKDGVGAQGLWAGCQDAALVMVSIVDKDGNVVPDANNTVTFSITGDATLAGTCNGDPASLTPNISPVRPSYHGLSLAVVKGGTTSSTITVTASSPGLGSVSLPIAQTLPPQGSSVYWCHSEPTL